MNMVLRVGHHTPGLEIIIYPPGWQGLMPELGLQQGAIYKVDCEYFRKRIAGDDENITALVEEYVRVHSGEDVTAVTEKNREQVTALCGHVNKRTSRERFPNVISLPEDDYWGMGR